MSKCDKTKKNINTIIENNIAVERIYDGYLDKLFGKNVKEKTDKIAEELEKEGYDAHSFILWKEIDKEIVKLYGKKSDRLNLAIQIRALLKANPGLVNLMHNFIIARLPADVQMTDKKKGYVTKSGEINLERFPIGRLRLFRNKITDLVNQVNLMGASRAKIGSFYSQFKTPGKLAWLDPTGGFEAISSGVREHASRISSNINKIMEAPEFLPETIDKDLRKAANKIGGMAKVLKVIDELNLLGAKTDNTKEMQIKFHKLFSMVMKNHVFIKDGKFYINQEYSPRQEYTLDGGKTWVDITWNWDGSKFKIQAPTKEQQKKDGYEIKIKRYETGKAMFSFQNPTLLKNYTPKTNKGVEIGKKGEYFIDMTPVQFKKFKTATEQARIMANITFEYVVPEMKKSTNNLLDSLVDYFDNKLHPEVVHQIFFYGNEVIDSPTQFIIEEYQSIGYTLKTRKNEDGETEQYIDLLEPLSKKEIKYLSLIKETINATANDSLVIANEGAYNEDEPSFRKNYWPTKYWDDNLRFMYDGLLDEWEKSLAKLQEIEDWENKPEIVTAIEKFEKMIVSVKEIINNMDNYHWDAQTGRLMHYASDNKHFKRISNAFDIRNSRTDGGVYYDYLADMFSTIERNKLNADLVEMLKRLKIDGLKSKPKLDERERQSIINTGVNLHRTTYHSVKTAGMFGDTEQVTNIMNAGRMANPANWIRKGLSAAQGKPYTISVTPEQQQRIFRKWTSRISGLFLQNWKSAVTNVSGAFQNIIESGLERTYNSIILYNNPTYSKGITRLIQQSGITEFSDFFSKQMVNGILGQQIESDISEQILKEILNYHMSIKGTLLQSKKTKAQAKKDFMNNIEGLLQKSSLWKSAEDIIIKGEERTKARIVEVRSRMKLFAANKLVQWAINKEYELKPMVVDTLWQKYVATKIGTVPALIGPLIRATGLTMGNTEKHIRSISFINGVQNAWETGVLRNDIHWSEYTNEEDVATAIKIGREFSYFINFGMSTQDVASYQYGPTQIFGKFKYWMQQKAEADKNAISNAIYSLKNEKDNKNSIYKLRPILKMLAAANFSSNRKNRLARPDIAAVRSMWLMQGLGTIAWNLFFLNPISLGAGLTKDVRDFANAAMYRTGSSHQLRGMMTSSLMHWLTLPIVYGIRQLIDGHIFPDDDEDLDREIQSHIDNNPFAGYGFTYVTNSILMLANFIDGDRDVFARRFEQQLSIIYGRPQVGFGRDLAGVLMGIGKAAGFIIYDEFD